MTCLVAIRHARGVVLGGDAAATTDAGDLVRSTKIHQRGEVWLAVAGTFRSIGLMLDKLSTRAAPKDLLRWIRAARPRCDGIAWSARGGLCVWTPDDVVEIVDFAAVGAGEAYAMGAIHALRAQGASPVATVVGALRAAAACRTDVAGPFTVVRLPAGEIRTYR